MQKHDWFIFTSRAFPNGLPCCRRCGTVKRSDGWNADAPCKGPVGVTPRTGSASTGGERA